MRRFGSYGNIRKRHGSGDSSGRKKQKREVARTRGRLVGAAMEPRREDESMERYLQRTMALQDSLKMLEEQEEEIDKDLIDQSVARLLAKVNERSTDSDADQRQEEMRSLFAISVEREIAKARERWLAFDESLTREQFGAWWEYRGWRDENDLSPPVLEESAMEELEAEELGLSAAELKEWRLIEAGTRQRLELDWQSLTEWTEEGRLAAQHGLAPEELQAWRIHQTWYRENYGLTRESLERCRAEKEEAERCGLNTEQLKTWRIYQAGREYHGADPEGPNSDPRSLDTWATEEQEASRLRLSSKHLDIWRRYRRYCDLEGLKIPSLKTVLQGRSRPLPRSFTSEYFGAWLEDQLLRHYCDLHPEDADLDRAIVEAKSWSKSDLPANYLGVWWMYQSRREVAGFDREPFGKAKDVGRAAKRDGKDASELDLQLMNDVFHLTTGLPNALKRAATRLEGEQRDPQAERAFGTHMRLSERSRHFVNGVWQAVDTEQPIQMQPPSSEELRDAQRVGLPGAVRDAWLFDNATRMHMELDPRPATDAKEDWLECRRRQVTLFELGVWWGVQTNRQAEGLDRECPKRVLAGSKAGAPI